MNRSHRIALQYKSLLGKEKYALPKLRSVSLATRKKNVYIVEFPFNNMTRLQPATGLNLQYRYCFFLEVFRKERMF